MWHCVACGCVCGCLNAECWMWLAKFMAKARRHAALTSGGWEFNTKAAALNVFSRATSKQMLLCTPCMAEVPVKGYAQLSATLLPLLVRSACVSIQLLPVFQGYLLAMHCRAVATCACGIVKFQFTTLDLVTSAASCWHCGSQLHLFRVDTMWPGQIFGRKQRKLNVVTAAAEDEAQIP